MAESDEEYYEVPLKDQRYFGADIKRKRITFVPSTTSLPASPGVSTDNSSRLSASERYLAVVLRKSKSESQPPSEKKATTEVVANDGYHDSKLKEVQQEEPTSRTLGQQNICEVCNMPVDLGKGSNSHASSLVHQICRPHSHPPSALDRERKGLSILQAHGWDPDARVGLGSSGEGILHPVKAKEKRDTVGLGHGKEDEDQARLKPRKKKERPKEVKKLDAGQIRKLDAEQKKKDRKLREMFYMNEDVEKYLGGG